MAALFPPWSNTAIKLAVIVVASGAVLAVASPMLYVRTAYNTFQYEPPDQPVEFDHRHHAGDAGIDCLYCHSGAETSPVAGLPTTDVCMGCHDQIRIDSPLLEPVRRSYFTGEPIAWNRVHDVPDFVYFDHSIHVQGGIDCAVCHGRVDQMARVYRVARLTMTWCLDCHREPAAHIDGNRPAEQGSVLTSALAQLEPDFGGSREVTALTTCSACHR